MSKQIEEKLKNESRRYPFLVNGMFSSTSSGFLNPKEDLNWSYPQAQGTENFGWTIRCHSPTVILGISFKPNKKKTKKQKNFNWVMLHYNGSMAHYWHGYPQSLRISHFSLQILMNASKLKSARSLKYINFIIYTLYYVLEISQIEY